MPSPEGYYAADVIEMPSNTPRVVLVTEDEFAAATDSRSIVELDLASHVDVTSALASERQKAAGIDTTEDIERLRALNDERERLYRRLRLTEGEPEEEQRIRRDIAANRDAAADLRHSLARARTEAPNAAQVAMRQAIADHHGYPIAGDNDAAWAQFESMGLDPVAGIDTDTVALVESMHRNR